MLTPIVNEIPRAGEPVGRDTFIASYERHAPLDREPETNVISLSAHRSQAFSLVAARAA